MIRNVPIIAFDGTNASGKTTLIYSVASHLKERGVNCEILGEPGRYSPMSEEVLLYGKGSFDLPIQTEIMAMHLVQSVRATKNTSLIIADRTPINTLAYTYLLTKPESKRDEELIEISRRLAGIWTAYYDKIFYCQDFFNPLQDDDKIRRNDIEVKKILDSKTRELYKQADLELVFLPKNRTLEERTAFVMDELSSFI